MNKLLKIEINRLIDMLNKTNSQVVFDAYIKELYGCENLPYPELKYYLEQIKKIIDDYGDTYAWHEELSALANAINLLEKSELEELEEKSKTEPLKKFWNSFKLWTEHELPYMNIMKPYYLRYDNWDGGSYYLDIDMPVEFTLQFGLDYDDRFDKETITIENLKLFIELFYSHFVEDRYNYTKLVNDQLIKFKLPFRLTSGKLTKKGYKTSETNPLIINYQMLESKILWSEDRILGKEQLDKHTALNYITDSLEYIISLIKDENKDKQSIEQKCAQLVCSNQNSKIYSVVKTEVNEIQKIVNDYFDIRHNEYINKSKENREPLNDSVFIEYLYNRIYSILSLLKIYYSKNKSSNNNSQAKNEIEDELPF